MSNSPLGYPRIITGTNAPPSTSPQPASATSLRSGLAPMTSQLQPQHYQQPLPAAPRPYMSPPSDGAASEDVRMHDAGLSRVSPPSASQKRSYRQRRKDPSCDLCRERKVKCDATDVSACTECSSRSYKCQFTKETNRRMSSLKQVQDLEKQLHAAKAQISHLKGMASRDPESPASAQPAPTTTAAIPASTLRDRAHVAKSAGNFFKVRRNIRNYGRGVFKPPHAYRMPGPQLLFSGNDDITLPPLHLVRYLLSQYRAVFHPLLPIIHWPTFQEEVDSIYRSGSLRGVRRAWMGVFFGIIACAATIADDRISEHDALGYCEVATMMINTLSDEVSDDHARTCLMISVYFLETNRRSAAWIWLGGAVRTAQESGLYVEAATQGSMQLELRRRLWWSVYSWDRQCSLDLGQSLDGADPDVEVGEPAPIDDHLISQDGIQPIDSTSTGPNSLIALIPAVRVIHQLKKTLKSKIIPSATLAAFDEHFKAIMDSYPDPYPIGSTTPLDPFLLHPALALQINRFMLHRHNLSPLCRMQERQEALLRCVGIANDTAHYIWRTTAAARNPNARPSHPPDMSDAEWHRRIRYSMPSFVVKHLWRCALILCFTSNFSTALTIIGALEAVGFQRKVNIACGRNLTFFLDLVMQKWQTGRGQDVDTDEEMLAYASGDLQGSSACAWAWTGSDSRSNSVAGGAGTLSAKDSITGEMMIVQPALLTEEEEGEWGGWPKVQSMIQNLQYLQRSTVGTNVGEQIAASQRGLSPEHTRLTGPSVLPQQHSMTQQRSPSFVPPGLRPPSPNAPASQTHHKTHQAPSQPPQYPPRLSASDPFSYQNHQPYQARSVSAGPQPPQRPGLYNQQQYAQPHSHSSSISSGHGGPAPALLHSGALGPPPPTTTTKALPPMTSAPTTPAAGSNTNTNTSSSRMSIRDII